MFINACFLIKNTKILCIFVEIFRIESRVMIWRKNRGVGAESTALTAVFRRRQKRAG
jgi:hypothetical protein